MSWHHYSAFILILNFVGLWVGCERSFTPAPLSEDERRYVVEGYIEAGESPKPPWVLLTRNQSFFEEISADVLEGLFVHDADVKVSDGTSTVTLQEICYNDLPTNIRTDLLRELGIANDSLGINLCVYIDLSGQMVGEIGKTYELFIAVEDQIITATTFIPPIAPVDSLRFVKPTEATADSLLEMRAFVNDPAGEANFYRYQTRINDGAFLSAIQTVSDDRFFDGKQFEFPLVKGELPSAEIDPKTYGLFTKGDSMTLRWMNIDEAQYQFWLTLEFNAVNQGPFSSQTRIDDNVNGALGLWGGVSALYYRRAVQE